MSPYFDRGVSWAILRRKTDASVLLIYGTHPVCCTDSCPVIPIVKLIDSLVDQHKSRHPKGIAVVLGDMNASYHSPAMILMRQGWTDQCGSGPHTINNKFIDTFGGDTGGSFGVTIDYVMVEGGNDDGFGSKVEIIGGNNWNDLPGGSDHWGKSGDIKIHR